MIGPTFSSSIFSAKAYNSTFPNPSLIALKLLICLFLSKRLISKFLILYLFAFAKLKKQKNNNIIKKVYFLIIDFYLTIILPNIL